MRTAEGGASAILRATRRAAVGEWCLTPKNSITPSFCPRLPTFPVSPVSCAGDGLLSAEQNHLAQVIFRRQGHLAQARADVDAWEG